MDDFGEQVPIRILQKLKLSEESVRDHIIRPDNIREVTTGIEKRVFELLAEAAPPSGRFYRLNVDQLGRDLHDLLSVCLVGYSLQLRRYGKVLLEQQWKWAQTPADGTISWAADVRMHLASVSKLITAMAMAKLLDARGISHDASIGDWLPRYWSRGPNVGRITFRHLMTHTSGLNFKGDRTPSDFAFMKAQIARGTNDLVTFDYQNTNFGLCRVLISTVNGSIGTGITYNQFGLDLSDSFWDAVTIGAYRQYVSDNICAPAGVSMPTLDHPSDDALAYTFPATGPGWNSGDLKTMSGGVGWHMSLNDLLAVMSAFRRQGKIMSVAKAETMLDSEFGLDLKKDTPLGRVYAKGGFWGDSGGRIEQSNAFFLPKGMELVVLANSPFCGPNGAFMDRVTAAIEANVENIFSLIARLTGLLNWLRRAK